MRTDSLHHAPTNLLGARRPAGRLPVAVGLVVLAAVVHMALAWVSRNPGFLTGQDDAQYLLLGQSIRAGGYHELFRVDQPIHALYPPGYAAMLAVWGILVGDRYDGLVALSVLFGGASVVMMGLTLQRLVTPALAVAATWLVAVNVDVIRYSGAISSEAPFMFLSVASLAVLARPATSRRWLVLAGLLALAAAMTRMVGVSLIGAVGLSWLLERRFRPPVWLALGALVTVGAWFAWVAAAPEQYEGVSYARDLTVGIADTPGITSLIERPWVNGIQYLRRLAWTLGVPTVQGTLVDNVAAAIGITLAAIAGLWVLIGRWPAAGWYGLAYLALIGVWTWVVGRYLVPIEVVLIPAIVLGADRLAAAIRPRWASLAGIAVAIGLGLTAVRRTVDLATAWRGCDRDGAMPPVQCLTADQADFFDALRYVARETPPDAVLLAAKYVTTYYYTRRPTASLHGALARDSSAMIGFLRDQGVTHVLLGRLLFLEGNQLGPSLRGICRALEVERSFGQATTLFRLRPAGASVTESGEACETLDRYVRLTAGDTFGEYVPRLLDRSIAVPGGAR